MSALGCVLRSNRLRGSDSPVIVYADELLRPGRKTRQTTDNVVGGCVSLSNGEAHVSLCTVTRISDRTRYAMCGYEETAGRFSR